MGTKHPEVKGKETIESNKIEILVLNKETPTYKGRLTYHPNDRTQSVLRLKKDILKRLPKIAQDKESLVWLIKICETWEDFRKETKNLEKDSDNVPFILQIGKERREHRVDPI